MKKLLAALLLVWVAPLWAEDQPAPQEKAPKLQVQMITVEQGTVRRTYDAPVTIRSPRRVVLNAQAPGPIARINVKKGDRVKAGDLLLELSHPMVDAQILSAKGNLSAAATQKARAADDLARQKRLLKAGYITEGALTGAQAAAKAAAGQAAAAAGALKSAEAALINYRVVAPFDGTILRDFDLVPGQDVTPGMPLFDLAQLDRLEAQFEAPETMRSRLKSGAEATITADGLDRPVDAALAEMDPYIDPATRTFGLRLELKETGTLAPGAFGTAHLVLEQARGLLVPVIALQDPDSDPWVMTVVDGKTHRQPVKLGLSDGHQTVILEGLKQGDKVITRGGGRMDEGLEVEMLSGS